MSTSNMPARIWAWGGTASGWTPRKFIDGIPAREYVRADIVEAMAGALADISTNSHHPWSARIASAALTSYREASNDQA